jgi:hypothetical protein
VSINDIKERQRYNVRGDILEVTEILWKKAVRKSRVRFVVKVKGRPTGQLEVGETGELGIVNFASWAVPVLKRGKR